MLQPLPRSVRVASGVAYVVWGEIGPAAPRILRCRCSNALATVLKENLTPFSPSGLGLARQARRAYGPRLLWGFKEWCSQVSRCPISLINLADRVGLAPRILFATAAAYVSASFAATRVIASFDAARAAEPFVPATGHRAPGHVRLQRNQHRRVGGRAVGWGRGIP